MISCLLAVLLQQPSRDFRAQYEVSGQWGQESLSASLVLSRALNGDVVLVGRQNLAGNLFYLWLNPRAVVLYLPRERTAFQGPADSRFSLFRGGPVLSGDQWLALFQGEGERDLHPFTLSRLADETRLTGPDFLLSFRKKSAGHASLKSSIFAPVVPAGTRLLTWEDYEPR